MNRVQRLSAVLVLATAAAGCATTGESPADPLEPVNRAIFKFNEGLDDAVLKPVAQGYRAVLPGVVRAGVTNFFSNIEDVWIGINGVLQGKVEQALSDGMRVVINTTFGLLGVLDVASEAGLEKHNEDFGQTLGRWGFGSGPYLVLPVFGPSSLRDGIGTSIDLKADPVVNLRHVPTRNTTYALRTIERRSNLLDATQVFEQAALDKYTFTRESYLQSRRNQVYDGNPPRERENEPSSLMRPKPALAGSDDLTPALAETARSTVCSGSGAAVMAGSAIVQTTY